MKGLFSTPICTRKQKSGPSSADLAFSIASCNSRHAWSAKAVAPPTSPCPTLSASAEPISETHRITTLDTANEIHEPIMRFTTCLTRVATHKVLDKCLGLDSSLACLLLLNFWPHVPVPSPTISPLNTKLYSLKALFTLLPPSFTCISTSARS